jgi:FtsZ-interacting cell division protein ZipA
MTTSTIIWIVVAVIAAVSLIAAIAWVARNKRTEHHRVQAGDMREKAVEQSHKVGQREALADETAAKARAAQAEAEAMSARAAGLHHQAQAHRSDAATSRGEVNRQFERADKIDPDSDARATARDDSETRDTPHSETRDTPHSETRDTPRGTREGKQGRPPVPRAG